MTTARRETPACSATQGAGCRSKGRHVLWRQEVIGIEPIVDVRELELSDVQPRRDVIRSELHYAVVAPTTKRRFDPRRVDLVWWGGSRRTIRPLGVRRPRPQSPRRRRRRRRWSDAELRGVLRVWLAETTEQRISHYEADRHANPQLPSANAPTSRFGSWS